VQVAPDHIGLVIAQLGEALRTGARSAVYKPEFGSFADIRTFLANGGQRGVQRPVLHIWLLDAQAADRSRDHELLDLLGALEYVVGRSSAFGVFASLDFAGLFVRTVRPDPALYRQY
jgi:hypothetical protein